jgi:hypothetical protein
MPEISSDITPEGQICDTDIAANKKSQKYP